MATSRGHFGQLAILIQDGSTFAGTGIGVLKVDWPQHLFVLEKCAQSLRQRDRHARLIEALLVQ